MNAEQMWIEYKTMNSNTKDEYESWTFGIEADLLADLVLRGKKTATSSAYPLYQIENEPLPVEGEYSIILDSENRVICVIKTTKVYVEEFKKQARNMHLKKVKGINHYLIGENVMKFFLQCV